MSLHESTSHQIRAWRIDEINYTVLSVERDLFSDYDWISVRGGDRRFSEIRD